MGRTFDTGFLRNVVAYDASGNVGLGGAVDATYKLKVTGAMQVTGAATFSSSVTATKLTLSNLPSSQAIFINDDGGYIAGYNTAGSTRNGYLQFNTGGPTVLAADGSNYLSLNTNGLERMRITSSGNVGIGTSSPSDYIGHNTLHINGKSGALGGVLRLTSFNGVSGVNIYTDSGGICFNASTSSPFIWYRQDVEVMRMTSGSVLTIGSSTPAAGNYKIYTTGLGGVWADASNPGDAAFVARGETGFYFYGMNTFSVLKFNVAQSGQISSTSTSITAISDIRHKENIRPIEKGLNEIMQLKPSRFDWKEGKGTGKKDVAGFIAQDIEIILPDLVDEWKESMTTNETFKSIRMGDLIPYLVKAIQELKAENDTLKTRIENLENK